MHVVLGTGPLGRAVIKELQKRGEPFKAVNFSGRQTGSGEILVVKADLMSADQAKAALAGASVIYQCTQPPYQHWEGRFEQMQNNIIGAAMASGAKLVAAENVYMYGDVHGDLHEGLPYTARTKKGRIRATLAEQLLELHRRGELQIVLGRGADFFGPGVTD